MSTYLCYFHSSVDVALGRVDVSCASLLCGGDVLLARGNSSIRLRAGLLLEARRIAANVAGQAASDRLCGGSSGLSDVLGLVGGLLDLSGGCWAACLDLRMSSGGLELRGPKVYVVSTRNSRPVTLATHSAPVGSWTLKIFPDSVDMLIVLVV